MIIQSTIKILFLNEYEEEWESELKEPFFWGGTEEKNMEIGRKDDKRRT